MRKLLIATLFIFLTTFTAQTLTANEYSTFQDYEFEHSGMYFLDSYTDDMYEDYYEMIPKKKFWGWSILTAYKTEKIYYTKETLWVIHNEGFTPIVQTFSFSAEDSVKKQYNVSGDLGLKGSGSAMGFKLGLDEKLSYSIIATTNSKIEEDFDIKIQVDPNTKLYIEIKGEGKVSNGVAKYYRFWRKVREGGWEVFLVTTEYYSIRKEVIDESLLDRNQE
ncbi:hypothetical protein KQ51_01431 [Candidatus Izimaplasma bacterium HR1]|uniref:hypothetical protein n=1 Tax=Candidatus Izimoplasma sp. HR1 TaxID=1541959 RepID=UPI0004F73B16|nr:hypothetical protein KQ51_01431 [Candidatus Izimaplasma bacterium HR1]